MHRLSKIYETVNLNKISNQQLPNRSKNKDKNKSKNKNRDIKRNHNNHNRVQDPS